MRAGLGKTNIRDTIKKREHIGISFDEIEAAVKRHMHVPNFCVLDSLSNHPSTHDIFKGKDIALILCNVHEHGHTSGINHWVSLLKTDNARKFWFFDSLGNTIQGIQLRVSNGKQSLTNWARQYKIVNSLEKLQSWAGHLQTCGQHQIVRVLHKNLDPGHYIRWLKSAGMKPDMAVAYMTYLDLLR